MWFVPKINGWHEDVNENVVRLCIQLSLDHPKAFSGSAAGKRGAHGALDFGVGGNNKKVNFMPYFYLASFFTKTQSF
jgi:hypothetical protein